MKESDFVLFQINVSAALLFNSYGTGLPNKISFLKRVWETDLLHFPIYSAPTTHQKVPQALLSYPNHANYF